MISGQVGVWGIPFRSLPLDDAARLAETVHAAGFTTVWVPGGRDESLLDRLIGLVRLTSGASIASGVLVSWRHPPEEVAARLLAADPVLLRRLVLGIGVSHPEISLNAASDPVGQIADYLRDVRARLDAEHTPTIVLGALGPRMTRLAGEAADGAHPYHMPPAHTERSRGTLGPGKLLAPEQPVILETDPEAARTIAREHLAAYLGTGNYRRSWLASGFSEDDLDGRGSDRFIDGVVAWGSVDRIRERVAEHRAAGADHVAVQILQPAGVSAFDAPWTVLGAALHEAS
ncbi:MAG: putative F420-dependent oxidoreductase [Rhodoglobus sp.]|nr:putative F420-dependent oxidoreductase [Rhodoglobus sp.]